MVLRSHRFTRMLWSKDVEDVPVLSTELPMTRFVRLTVQPGLLGWSIFSFHAALLAGVLGFGGICGLVVSGICQILFFVFALLFLLLLDALIELKLSYEHPGLSRQQLSEIALLRARWRRCARSEGLDVCSNREAVRSMRLAGSFLDSSSSRWCSAKAGRRIKPTPATACKYRVRPSRAMRHSIGLRTTKLARRQRSRKSGL
jgi:uncharacterized membrane protein YtjA (UPF0391 family)